MSLYFEPSSGLLHSPTPYGELPSDFRPESDNGRGFLRTKYRKFGSANYSITRTTTQRAAKDGESDGQVDNEVASPTQLTSCCPTRPLHAAIRVRAEDLGLRLRV